MLTPEGPEYAFPVELAQTVVWPLMVQEGNGLTVTAKLFVAPAHPAALVSVTVTLPLVAPNVTVMLLLFGPTAPDVICYQLQRKDLKSKR